MEEKSIFRGSDIRGVFGKSLNDNKVQDIIYSFIHFLKCKKVIIGRDTRISSPHLRDLIVKTITESGVDIIDLGVADTPQLYFATHFFKLPAVMITASHNPKEYNGLILISKKTIIIDENNGLNKIKSLSERHIKLALFRNKGRVFKKDITKEYVRHILSFVNTSKINNIKIVADMSNGSGSFIFKKVFSKLNAKFIPIYFQPDGRFPNHNPDPSKYENLKDLQKNVIKNKADLGIAFDGDGDRVFFIDEKGKIVSSSVSASLIIKYFLKLNKLNNEKIVYSSTCSNIVPEIIKSLGGVPVIGKVGHAFIKNTMRNKKALFGCEESGHLYYKDNFYADSSVISAVIICSILSKENKKLSELSMEFNKYSKINEMSIKIKNKDEAIKKVIMHYKNKNKPRKTSHYDGLRMDFNDYWFSLRESRTEDFLRLNLEAKNEQILNNKLKELLKIINL